MSPQRVHNRQQAALLASGNFGGCWCCHIADQFAACTKLIIMAMTSILVTLTALAHTVCAPAPPSCLLPILCCMHFTSGKQPVNNWNVPQMDHSALTRRMAAAATAPLFAYDCATNPPHSSLPSSCDVRNPTLGSCLWQRQRHRQLPVSEALLHAKWQLHLLSVFATPFFLFMPPLTWGICD